MKTKIIIDPVVEIENITKFIKNYFIDNGTKNTKAVIGISGGKDSTIAAALLCRALGPERVVAVMMPNGEQADIEDSYEVCNLLNIPWENQFEINIGPTVKALYNTCWVEGEEIPSIVSTNTPARIRMTTLYMIAGIVGGRVVNTCNYSEDFVGYSTKYGDSAGDFSLFQHYTVTEVRQIGAALGLPDELVYKTPSDGMCGRSDEDNLGFTYEVLDKYIRNNEIPDYDILRLIEEKHKNNMHKMQTIRLSAPYPQWIKVDEEGNQINEGVLLAPW